MANNGFPFEIKKRTANPYVALTEEKFLDKLEASRKHANQGLACEADEVVSDMRKKYGL